MTRKVEGGRLRLPPAGFAIVTVCNGVPAGGNPSTDEKQTSAISDQLAAKRD
jgi:hypothetical protein